MKFGRADRDFLKWRWKPYDCELPVFDPVEFLEMMRGKSLAFVGDSVARNHMQSLLCLLSRVRNENGNRSFLPSHFECGRWDKGGDCVRTKPLKSNESVMADYNLEMYKTQLQEYKFGEREGRRKGIKIGLMDMTQAMQLRPDVHPSKYGHWPSQNVTMAKDCVHWCLPSPIDAWNDFLMELFKREKGYR
ncbi:hypothetical protein L1987_71672 [Smallanthus sonchifolius]|uniref:Uncharacterized protein n=1 Tax=Smallanthus sonchifolius TaxID=185202 RepID=A0ACB9ATR3_9ASTR|nr:hypothetical protein L1987_71672 [Smallanthus sonchifolius]